MNEEEWFSILFSDFFFIPALFFFRSLMWQLQNLFISIKLIEKNPLII